MNSGEYYLYNNVVYSDSTDSTPGGIIQFGFAPAAQYPEHVTLYNNIIYGPNFFDPSNCFQGLSTITGNEPVKTGYGDGLFVAIRGE